MRYLTVFRSPAALLSCCAALLLLASPGTGQSGSLSWTETVKVEVGGTVGTVLQALPGALDTRSSARSIHLNRGTLIEEDGRQATIMDAENRRVVSIDHEAQTYTVFSFDESAEAVREMSGLMEEAMAGVDEAMAETREERNASMAELRQAMEEAREALDFSIRAEKTGRTRSFGDAGLAEQHLVTAELSAAAPPRGVEDAEPGTLVFVMELWQSRDLPTPEAFHEEWGERLAADPEFQAIAAGLKASAEDLTEASAASLAMWDPRMSAGLTELAKVVEGLDGTNVRSAVTVALVAADHPLEYEELLAWEPETMGDRLRAEAGSAVKEAASNAARGALRGLTRRFGGGGDDAEDEAAEEELPPVRPLLRFSTTKEDIVYEAGGADALEALQQRMDAYREVTLDDLMAGAEVP